MMAVSVLQVEFVLFSFKTGSRKLVELRKQNSYVQLKNIKISKYKNIILKEHYSSFYYERYKVNSPPLYLIPYQRLVTSLSNVKQGAREKCEIYK